ncbi:NAD(P)H-binding protein [Lutibacter sp. B1]|uniref:NAD(P)H-binding protein n=1 Tax=Lutibacter sp. B1 TaxID=2725996 RepID=UPI0014570220|nr:NAD(P)H-binding protein [Lutibacter sp. B1]NLP57282.1 NAD(P)H-binding protein [Lutibacter sp. B1]
MGKTAIILGATGLTGKHLLNKLTEDDRYTIVKVFSRKKMEGLHPKVTQKTGNLLALESFKDDFIADEVYCCIGTTAKKTPDKELYKKIDYGIPVAAAKLAKENHIKTFMVVSAMGANPKSTIFYNRTKGRMEQDVLKEKIANTYILRPSLITGVRNENRPMEKIGFLFFKLIDPLLVGKLKRYRMIKAENIAEAMLNLANSTYDITQIITSDKIQEIATNN